jgi:hypothetical protein
VFTDTDPASISAEECDHMAFGMPRKVLLRVLVAALIALVVGGLQLPSASASTQSVGQNLTLTAGPALGHITLSFNPYVPFPSNSGQFLVPISAVWRGGPGSDTAGMVHWRQCVGQNGPPPSCQDVPVGASADTFGFQSVALTGQSTGYIDDGGLTPGTQYCYVSELPGNIFPQPNNVGSQCATALATLPDAPSVHTHSAGALTVQQTRTVTSDPSTTPLTLTAGPVSQGGQPPCQCWQDWPGASEQIDVSDAGGIASLDFNTFGGSVNEASNSGQLTTAWRLVVDDTSNVFPAPPSDPGGFHLYPYGRLEAVTDVLTPGTHTVKLQYRFTDSCVQNACNAGLSAWTLQAQVSDYEFSHDSALSSLLPGGAFASALLIAFGFGAGYFWKRRRRAADALR